MTGGKMWRNHYKFFGILPDFRGFEKIKSERLKTIDTDKPFKERRTLLLIFRWLSPDVVMLKLLTVCKKFYMLSWSAELMNNLVYY